MAASTKKSERELSPLDELETLLWFAVLAGLVALLAANDKAMLAAVGIGVLIFLASFGAGAFIGFLFGVPRVLSRESETAAPPAAPQPGVDQAAAAQPQDQGQAGAAKAIRSKLRLLSSNTNLERISDWLTTMLVGASLVELHSIGDGLLAFRLFLASSARVFPGPGGQMNAGVLPAIGPIILVFGAASGFLFMYLSTRLVLVRMFDAVERSISGEDDLPSSEQRTLRAYARADGPSLSFVGGLLSTKQKLTVGDALNLMLDLLYKGDPDRVISLGAELSGTEAVNRADYWFYLAAAFGQKMQTVPEESEEWASARDNALDCARRAVALNAAYRERLWAISDPDGHDDDLKALRNDPEFLRIVGR